MGIELKVKLGADIDKNVKLPKMAGHAKNILELCDDLNATQPASSSGKWHPIADLGSGGLIRHSKMVAELVLIMIRSDPTYDDPALHDIMYLSGLLHDLCKYKAPEPTDEGYPTKDAIHTNFDHPLRMASLIESYIETTFKDVPEDSEDFEIMTYWRRIATNIASHMSRWNTSHYEPGVALPTCETPEQYIISFADLIASNKDLPELMAQYKEDAIKELTGRM